MTNYREILRQYSLGLNKSQIAAACGYSRNTVAHAISLAEENGLSYPLPEGILQKLSSLITAISMRLTAALIQLHLQYAKSQRANIMYLANYGIKL